MTETSRQEAITPRRDGKPPAFVVACLDCGFSCDEHGIGADDAVKAVAPRHAVDHKLVARPVDYTKGYGPDKRDAHPLYA